MPATQTMTAKQLAATLKGLSGKGLEIEAEAARQAVTAKGMAGGAGAKGAGVAVGAKGAGMAAGAKGAGMAAGAKGAGAAAGTSVTGATTAGAKTAAAGGFLTAGKGMGLGLGLGVWGPVILGLVGVAAVYGYVRSRAANNAQSDEEVELADALAEG